MKTILKIFSIIFIFLLISCSNEDDITKTDQQPLVKVFDNYLYMSDIQKIIPNNASLVDSANIVQTYINNWVQNQILLHYADTYLNDQIDDIEQKAEDFKESLIIHNFKDELVNANTDSIISNDQISNYYNAHNQDFKLGGAIITGFLVIVPKTSANIVDIKQLLENSNENDIDNIISYCNSVNGIFDDFTNNWVKLSDKIMKIPYAISDENYTLRTNKYLEASDDNYLYFIYFSNYINKGNIAPLEYVKDDISKILIQTQTNKIVNEFKQQKYDEALQQGNIVFYN